MLEHKLTTLAELNRDLEEAEAWAEAREEKLKRLPEYIAWQDCLDEKAEIKDEIEKIRENIKEEAIAHYAVNMDKHPVQGVNIRVYQKVNYDPDQAIEFCKAELPKALKLDKRTFEKHAKAVMDTRPIPFVQYDEEPRAAISTDLTMYLD